MNCPYMRINAGRQRDALSPSSAARHAPQTRRVQKKAQYLQACNYIATELLPKIYLIW